MIQFNGVTKEYEDGTIALKNLNLHIEEGELVTLIGPSGCGKTTTMKMINRLVEPTSGQILVNGEDIATIDPVQLRRNIGYVIQQIGLFPHMKIKDNISIVPRLKRMDKKQYEKRVDELLELVGLPPETFSDRYPNELSGGQQQRIGVIRALAAEPPIILMDEPFSALDPISREQLQDELVRLQQEIKKTIVFVTHDMDEALKIADRIILMKDGEIVQADTQEKILRKPQNEFVRGFIGEERLSQAGQLKVQDVMIPTPITASITSDLSYGAKLMEEHQINSLLVTDTSNVLRGIVPKEFLEQQAKQEDAVLEHIMLHDFVTVAPDWNVDDAVELMRERKLASLPVTDMEGKLIGLVTNSSLIDTLLKQV